MYKEQGVRGTDADAANRFGPTPYEGLLDEVCGAPVREHEDQLSIREISSGRGREHEAHRQFDNAYCTNMKKMYSQKRLTQRLHKRLMDRYKNGFSLDMTRQIEVAGRQMPVLKNGEHQIHLEHSVIDQFALDTGGTASVFVQCGEDFVRIATTVTDAKGVRSVGQVLERSHPAYRLVRSGQSYFGYSLVAGKKYIADYRPIFDSQRAVIGISAVGIDISDIKTLGIAVKLALATTGCATTLLIGRDALFKFLALDVVSWTFSYELMNFVVVCLTGFGLYALIKKKISHPLDRAKEAAQRLGRGDLSAQEPVDCGDEIGQILDALNGINLGLAALVSNVRRATYGLTVASRQIAVGSADLSARTEAQAGSLEQTAAAMDQLTSAVRNNADNARQADDFAASTLDLANTGADLMNRTVVTMNQIRATSRKVSDIVGTIEGIAFQTNILALNAAVEAARAGVEGRGFAVVAEEVRNLAQHSSNAAKEIDILITESVEKVDAGGQLIDQAGHTMTEIVGSVRRVATLMAEISRTSTEQSIGIEEVDRAVEHMDDNTQRNAALAEEAAAASASMQQQMSDLEHSARAFRLAIDVPNERMVMRVVS